MTDKLMDRGAELQDHLTWLTLAIGKADPSAVASLVRERRLTLAELAEVPVSGRSTRNEIADKRAARRAAAAAAKAPAGGRNKRSG